MQHRHFDGSVTWALTPEGISVEGAKPIGTTGAPNTVKAIWEKYGVHCAAAARDFTVPVELIVATIATESSGKPDAVRKEAKDSSYGLMQTLLGTAREALGDERLSGHDLLRPETSIRAGTAFIVRQRNLHKFDPVLVAAAYNAGSPRPARTTPATAGGSTAIRPRAATTSTASSAGSTMRWRCRGRWTGAPAAPRRSWPPSPRPHPTSRPGRARPGR